MFWLWILITAIVSGFASFMLCAILTSFSGADDWDEGYRAGIQEGKNPR